MATNYEKYASTPKKVASLIDQFRSDKVGAGRKSYQDFVARNIDRHTSTTTQLLTEWLQEECDG